MKEASLLKWTKGGCKSPMVRARGLGSARNAVHHWLALRVAAVLAVPLSLWLWWALAHLIHAPYDEITAWVARPYNAVLLILTLLAYFHHAALGAQTVIEDYIHNEGFKILKLAAMRIVLFTCAGGCVFCVLKLAL